MMWRAKWWLGWAALWLVGLTLAAGTVFLPNGAFEAGDKGWENLDGELREVRHAYGRNQSPGLKYSRLNPLAYELVSAELARPVPGENYRFGAWVRPGADMTGAASVCVEVTRNGEYLYGVYARDLNAESQEWQLLEHNFTTQGEEPAECRYYLRLYLRPESSGTVFFDDAFFESSAPEWLLSQTWPTHRRISARDGKFLLASSFIGAFAPAGAELIAEVSLLQGDKVVKSIRVPADSRSIAGAFGAVTPGMAELEIRLLSAEDRELAVRHLPVMIDDPAVAENACVIDEKGRAWVDGKLFLPLGLYGDRPKLEELDTLGASPFNCYLPYRLVDEWEPTREFMDRAHELGIKVIFSIKNVFPPGIAAGWCDSWNGLSDPDEIAATVVEQYKNHPALLAWYICDESPRSVMPALEERRRMVNRLDPNHPTWSVFYQRPDIPYYLDSLDMVGVDPYPIMSAAPGNLALVDQMGRQTEGLPLAVWGVPQAHSLGHYDAEVLEKPELFHRKYRYPSEEEMLANALLQAIYGAKGFVFYSFFDLQKGPDADQFAERWPQLCRVGARLQELAPFLLSDAPAPECSLENRQGTVRAAVFAAADGSLRLLAVGVEEGENEAVISIPAIPETDIRSLNGHMREISPGRYLFSASGISCDIVSWQ